MGGLVDLLDPQRAAEQQTLLEPVCGLVRREPVFCQAETPLRAALEAMSRAQVGTIVVVDADRQPVGIFTLTDLMEPSIAQLASQLAATKL